MFPWLSGLPPIKLRNFAKADIFKNMRIHFFATKAHTENAKKIPQILKKAGCHVSFEFLETEKRLKQDIADEKKADAIIIEIAEEPSFLALRIASVLNEKKPVLLLYSETSPVGDDLRSLASETMFRYLTIAAYNSKNLPEVLREYVKTLKKEKEAAARFNFILNSDLEKFLNWVPFGKKTAKSDFVRELIREAMEEDEEYRAFLKKKR